MFVRKPRDALKSIFSTASNEINTDSTRHQQTSHPPETLSQKESLAAPYKSKE
jgi:hypothetical protein